VECYKEEPDLTQLYNLQRYSKVWVHCKHPPRCRCCGGGHNHQECPE